MMYLFIALDEVVDGFDARAGDEIVQPNLLGLRALNTGLGGAGSRSGHFLNHMVDSFGGSFFDAFQGCIGGGTHGLTSQGFGGRGGEHATSQTGDRVKQSSTTVGILPSVTSLSFQHLFIGYYDEAPYIHRC